MFGVIGRHSDLFLVALCPQDLHKDLLDRDFHLRSWPRYKHIQRCRCAVISNGEVTISSPSIMTLFVEYLKSEVTSLPKADMSLGCCTVAVIAKLTGGRRRKNRGGTL